MLSPRKCSETPNLTGFNKDNIASKSGISTGHDQNLITPESGQDTSACLIQRHFFHAFYIKCLKTTNFTCFIKSKSSQNEENQQSVTKVQPVLEGVRIHQHAKSLAISSMCSQHNRGTHDDVFKWKHFPRYWLFVRGIHQSPVNSPHKGQWRGALMFSFICVWINSWVNNRGAGDLRCCCAHCDVIVMSRLISQSLGQYLPHTTAMMQNDIFGQHSSAETLWASF